jgi:hypothetical protein
MESSMGFLKKPKKEVPYDQVTHSWAPTQRNIRQDMIETPVHQCSLQQYSQ